MELLTLGMTSIIASLLVILCLAYYHKLVLRRTRAAKRPQLPPKAGGAWPLFGHLPLVAGRQLPHIKLGNLADKYGPIFTIKLGVHEALVLSSWEMAKELYTTNDVAVSTRPNSVAAKLLGYNYVMFGFAPYGTFWREIRKIVTVELLSSRRIESLNHVRISEVETSLKYLYKLWTAEKKMNGSDHVVVELKDWFADLTLNVILRMIAGKKYFGESAMSGEEEARRCQKALREFFRFLGLFVVRDAIPFLGWLDVGGHEKAMKRVAKELDEMLEKWLEEHRMRRYSVDQVTNIEDQDFMDVMISVLRDADFAGYDSDTILKSTCLNIIGGGSDTTTVTITWLLSLLLNNTQVLERAQRELDVVVGNERLVVNESDIAKLTYLQAVVKETLRLYPPPLSGPRQLNEDCTIGGFHVKRGTRVITNTWKIQRDPRIWEDPLAFKPERFLTSRHKHVDIRGQHFELIPFGSGRRVCPGISFGLQMVLSGVASFLHAFHVARPSTAPIDMTESAGLTNMKATPLHVLVSPRLPSYLYV